MTNSYPIKLTQPELAFFQTVLDYMLTEKPNLSDIELLQHRLRMIIIKNLYRRLLPRMTFPRYETKITLNEAEYHALVISWTRFHSPLLRSPEKSFWNHLITNLYKRCL